MDLVCSDVMRFGDTEIEVRELLSGELVEYLEGRNTPPLDVVTALILNNAEGGPHPVHQQLLFRCSNLTEEVAATLTPTQIVAVADRVRDLNPFCFRLRAALAAMPDPATETQA